MGEAWWKVLKYLHNDAATCEWQMQALAKIGSSCLLYQMAMTEGLAKPVLLQSHAEYTETVYLH